MNLRASVVPAAETALSSHRLQIDFKKPFILAPSCHKTRFSLGWYNEIPVAGFIWTLFPDGFEGVSACSAAELDELQETVWKIIMEILLVIQDYVLQCFDYLLQNTRQRECIITVFGIYDQVCFFFLIRKAIWKKIPVAQGFWSWWAALTSVAVLLGTDIEGHRSSAWRCLGSSPTHSSPPARWVVVCQETRVTGERHYLSAPMCLVCLLVQWYCDGNCFIL